MDEMIQLAIRVITEYVPQYTIANMIMLLFVVTCCCIMLIEIAIAVAIGNIANLVNRILPEAESSKVSNQANISNKFQWFKKLMNWKKASQ